MPAPDRIEQLVDRFHRRRAEYRGGGYNEMQARVELINPLFEELGWDVEHRRGGAWEVRHEDRVEVAGKAKAPDYGFHLNGRRVFFVEAKKPSVDLAQQQSPAYQLRRYAWSARLPVSILTDFEEFAVYDTRVRPRQDDRPAVARILYLTYDQYPDRWDDIAATFGREAVLAGSLEQFAEQAAGRRGLSTVDAEFLATLNEWRALLARNFALRNPGLSERDLNFAVQQTIDRIIFLRIAEDRGIEPYGRLQGVAEGAGVYERLVQLFRRADERYNSGLFHFRREGSRANPDTLTPGLALDDKALRDILRNLYYPASPYEFSVFPAEVLGQVYEQFLGKVIRLTGGGRAAVEEKPEVRKAGGVYYTPAYIVEYIVRQTVGRLVEGHAADPKGPVSRLRVLDPACGSGSFLIGAYQFLLDWHLDGYRQDAKKWLKGRGRTLFEAADGELHLTLAERKRILLDNLYGVDIDPQAVEVTKLSLLLKLLEGEAGRARAQQELFGERVLPDLDRNVKCGNSLIGPDFYQQASLFGGGRDVPPEGRDVPPERLYDMGEQLRINAFDWRAEFAEIMAAGGFDAVIGNPPYGAELDQVQKVYIRNNYRAYKYKYDSYIYFTEKAISLTKTGGWISYITPELWLRLENADTLRRVIREHTAFVVLNVLGEGVFSQAVVSTIIFVLRKGKPCNELRVEHGNLAWLIPTPDWADSESLTIDYRLRTEDRRLIEKVKSRAVTLSSLGEVIQGITPYDRYQGQDPSLIKSRGYHFEYQKDETCGKWLSGKDISRYRLSWSGEWLSYGPWLAAPRDPRFFNGPRLLYREIPGKDKRIQATFADTTSYYGHSITPFRLTVDTGIDLKFILGVTNSRLLSWYGSLVLPNFGKDIFPKLNPQDIKELPIRTIDFNDPADAARHGRMVELVERMLDLHRRLAAEQNPQVKTMLQRQIEATDRQIDALVYELYGLTEEEIRIVEGTG